jgi:hypothetical protein
MLTLMGLPQSVSQGGISTSGPWEINLGRNGGKIQLWLPRGTRFLGLVIVRRSLGIIGRTRKQDLMILKGYSRRESTLRKVHSLILILRARLTIAFSRLAR